ncbi:MAG TPA: hypothetical protein VF628_06295 [Allosphingosinicella sp.]|jgi:hypothetical protein
MSYYRLLFMKAIGGPVMGFEEIAARDDVEAVRIASRKVGDQPVELWCNKRKVKQFTPAGSGSAFSF